MNRVGRYEITEPLGQGGMGTVYKAYDPLLARIVAVKVISGQFSSQPDLRERFFREARAVARLDHPNIVTVYDLGEEEGVPYLAMQFLEGRDLEHRMRDPEGMTLARKVEIAIAVAAGLAHAHAAGIVHRDVKPANVFITDEGQVKLLDFGLARLVSSELTRSNVMVGTVNYMAPEQLRGDKTDHRVDIFSFGVVLYEMLGGRKPFQAESFASTMYKILEETPEPLEHLDPSLPPRLVAVVDRAIAKAREDRYQLMFELLRDLETAYEPIRGSDHQVVVQIESSLRASSQVRPKSNPPVVLGDPDAPTVVGTVLDRTVPAATQPLSAPSAVPVPRRSWRVPALAATAVAILLLTALYMREGSSRSDVAPAPRGSAMPAPQAPVVATPAPAPALPPAPTPPAEDPPTQAAPETAIDPTKSEAALKAADQEHLKRATIAMRTARASAVAANATVAAPQLFSAAEKQERGAREAADRGQLAAAAARMEAAATLYANAEASAHVQQDARAARQREAEAARAAEAAEAQQMKVPAASPTKPELPRPAPPAAAPAPTPPPAPAPPKPVETAAPKPAEPGIAADDTRTARESALGALRRYTSALEHRDIAALKAVWPGLGGREQMAIENDFQNARSLSVTFVNPKVDVSGAAATVSGVRQYSIVTRDGQALRSETVTTLALKRAGNDWLIESVRHQPK